MSLMEKLVEKLVEDPELFRLLHSIADYIDTGKEPKINEILQNAVNDICAKLTDIPTKDEIDALAQLVNLSRLAKLLNVE